MIGDIIGGLAKGAQDFGERIVDTVTEIGVASGMVDKEPCSISIDIDTGASKAEIDYSDVPKENRASIRAQGDAIASAVTHLKEKLSEAKTDGASPKELASLTKELESAQNLLTDFKFECEVNGLNPLELIAYAALGPIGGAIVDGMISNGADVEKLDAQYQSHQAFETEIGETNKGEVIASPKDIGGKQLEASSNNQVDKIIDPSVGDVLAKAGGLDKQEGSDKTGGVGNEGKEVDSGGGTGPARSGKELYALMKSDPDAFMKFMEENPAAGNILQDHMQAMNRFFSTISNVMKAEHDTQKAMINNFRV